MRARILVTALLLTVCALFPNPSHALKTHGVEVIVPIIGRFPGLNGTQWRTDLFLSNHSSLAKTIQMTFYASGGAPIVRNVELLPFSTATLTDVVQNTFGQANAGGVLQMRSSNESAFEARARIYNTGNPAGEFGQNVPGIATDRLGTQAYVFGLSGISGSRINAGVSNPHDSPVVVTMRLTSKNNSVLHVEAFAVQPHQNVQFGDIFSRFSIPPQADVQLEFTTGGGERIYGYASDVRNDTGDAVFIFGTDPNA